MTQLPTTRQLKEAMLAVLKQFPEGLRTEEIDSKVADQLALTPDQRAVLRSGNRTELSYRLAWERTQAKKAGLIERTSARTWKIIN